jgi:hypothetical protein
MFVRLFEDEKEREKENEDMETKFFLVPKCFCRRSH